MGISAESWVGGSDGMVRQGWVCETGGGEAEGAKKKEKPGTWGGMGLMWWPRPRAWPF